jgi:hypothetical protein
MHAFCLQDIGNLILEKIQECIRLKSHASSVD